MMMKMMMVMMMMMINGPQHRNYKTNANADVNYDKDGGVRGEECPDLIDGLFVY